MTEQRDTTILDVLPGSVPEVVRYFISLVWQTFISIIAIATVLMLIGALLAAMLFDTYTGILTGANMLFAGLLANIESGAYDLPGFVITISRSLPTIVSIITTGIVFALWQRINALMRELYEANKAGREPDISFSMAFGAFVGIVFQSFDTIFLDMPSAALFAGRGKAMLFWPSTFPEWSAVLLVFLFTTLNDPITALIISSAKAFMRKGAQNTNRAKSTKRSNGAAGKRNEHAGQRNEQPYRGQRQPIASKSAQSQGNSYFRSGEPATGGNGNSSRLEELRRKYGLSD